MQRQHAVGLVLTTLLLAGRLGAADEVKLSADEEKIVELVNKAREEKKLPPLKVNRQLTEAARKHSANMAKLEKMDHVLEGKKPSDRVKAENYDYSKMGENIAAGEGWKIDDVHKAWMESEKHRDNILDADYTEIGVGLARSDRGEVYYPQVLGKPQKK